jgi:hypothetical protein
MTTMTNRIAEVAPAGHSFSEPSPDGLDRLWTAILYEGEGFRGGDPGDLELALALRTTGRR